MKSRRKMLMAAVVTAPLLAIGAACTFPSVSFAPAGSSNEGGASDAPNGSDGPMMGEGGTVVGANEDVDPTGAMMDATTRPEGGPMIDAAGCTCDCDQDGFQPKSGTCDGGPGPRPDCDDFDDLIKPDAGFVAAPWTSTHYSVTDDWNCDGARTKQYDYNQPCTDPNNCNGKSGFAGDPNCNEEAVFNVCSYNAGVLGVVGASCKVGSTAMLRQGCK